MASKKTNLQKNGLIVLLAITAILAFVVFMFVKQNHPASEAAKGGGGGKPSGGTASITLNQTDPHLGDLVTFTTNAGSRIALACYQGGIGNMVYSADQAVGTAFLLGGTSSIWKNVGGEAFCYAWLYSRSLTSGFLAATTFNALGAR